MLRWGRASGIVTTRWVPENAFTLGDFTMNGCGIWVRSVAALVVCGGSLAWRAASAQTNAQPGLQEISSDWVQFEGKRISADRFRRVARKLSFEQLQRQANELKGKAVNIEGELVEGGSTSRSQQRSSNRASGPWTVRMEGGQVTVLPQKLVGANYGNGMQIRIWGIVQEGGFVEAILSELVPPALKWVSQMRRPSALRGSAYNDFWVDGFVQNTGKQKLSNLRFLVRLSNVTSSLATATLEIPELVPGQNYKFSMPIRTYISSYDNGGIQMPRSEMYLQNYELAGQSQNRVIGRSSSSSP